MCLYCIALYIIVDSWLAGRRTHALHQAYIARSQDLPYILANPYTVR